MKGTRSKKCASCNCCKRLYRRYIYDYWCDGKYFCTELNDLTKRENVCDKWRRRIFEYDLSNERLKTAEEDIVFLIETLT